MLIVKLVIYLVLINQGNPALKGTLNKERKENEELKEINMVIFVNYNIAVIENEWCVE